MKSKHEDIKNEVVAFFGSQVNTAEVLSKTGRHCTNQAVNAWKRIPATRLHQLAMIFNGYYPEFENYQNNKFTLEYLKGEEI